MKRSAWISMIAAVAACGGSSDEAVSTSAEAAGSEREPLALEADGASHAATACAEEQTAKGRIACGANAVLATLTDAQRKSVALPLTDYTNRSKWSNFPVQMNPRGGVSLSTLSAASRAAVNDLLALSLNDNGQKTASGIRAADEYLKARAGGYGADLYSIAIFGTPSSSSDFEVMFGGHHMAYNLTFVGDAFYPAPQHLGAEPKGAFELNGASYDPMSGKGDAMFAVYEALDATQRSAAYLSGQTYNDTVVAPSLDYNKGASRTSKTAYPTGANRRGLKVSSLTAAQQALVTAAIAQWVSQYPSELTDALMADYTSAYDDTLFAWAGASSGASKDVSRSYLRIDGPRVWIEVSVQNGIVIRGQTHYHTIYRDKTKDYGGQF